MSANQRPLLVGDWHVFRFENWIERDGQSHKLSAKAMDVLVYLAGRPGDVVSVDELVDNIWKPAIVTDNSVQVTLTELHKVLGDDTHDPQYIQTIRSRGYQLIAPVGEPESTTKSETSSANIWLIGALVLAGAVSLTVFWPENPPPTQRIHSIAVLPFENLSTSKENEFFAAGVHDDILSHLSKVEDLRVISHTSVMRFAGANKSLPEVAAELSVEHVLEGRVRRERERVRISVRLVEAVNDQPIWSETYDRDLADIFAVQSEVAKNVTDELKVALDVDTLTRIEAGPTENLDAYDLFLRGVQLMRTGSNDNLQRAIELFHQAVTLDPEFALAYARIAAAYIGMSDFVPWESVRSDALAAANHAYTLDPNASEVLLAQGLVKNKEYDFTFMEYIDRALEADPNNIPALTVKANQLRGLGEARQALPFVERALTLNPLDSQANMQMAYTLLETGQLQRAEQYVDRALGLTPTAGLHWSASGFYWYQGDHVSRQRHMHTAHQLEPKNVVYIQRIAQALLWLGDRDTAQAWLVLGEQLSPQSLTLLIERTDQLLAAGDYDAFEAHAVSWVSQNRTLRGQTFWLAKAKRIRARQALAAERPNEARSLLEASYDISKKGMESYWSDGELRIFAYTVFWVAEHAITAKLLGYEDEWQALRDQIFDHFEYQRNAPMRAFVLTLVHAADGDTNLALSHFADLPESFMHAEWHINEWATGLSRDPFGVFGGIHNSIEFKQTMDRLRSRNAEQLARVREELPELFALPQTNSSGIPDTL